MKPVCSQWGNPPIVSTMPPCPHGPNSFQDGPGAFPVFTPGMKSPHVCHSKVSLGTQHFLFSPPVRDGERQEGKQRGAEVQCENVAAETPAPHQETLPSRVRCRTEPLPSWEWGTAPWLWGRKGRSRSEQSRAHQIPLAVSNWTGVSILLPLQVPNSHPRVPNSHRRSPTATQRCHQLTLCGKSSWWFDAKREKQSPVTLFFFANFIPK